MKQIREQMKNIGWVWLMVVVATLLTVVIHEGAHLLAGAIAGIPLVTPPYLDLARGGISMVFAPTGNDVGRKILDYAGGLTAGFCWFALLVSLFCNYELIERSRAWWMAGMVAAMFAFWQVGQGLIEGGMHDAYTQVGGAAAQAVLVMQGFAIFLGAGTYFLATRRSLKFSKAN